MDCKKVSVIVPVYNVEKYLVRCLDSLCRQSLYDIEIILVDDASSDNSGRICEAFAAKDDRFRVIHHTDNRGVSAVRNTGIAHASGDYLMFVDSDDYVHEDFCRLPYECAVRYHADLVMFGYIVIPLQGDKTTEKTVSAGFRTQDEAIELLFSGNGYGTVPVNKLYSKSLFSGILYPEGIIYEDTATSYKLIWKAARIYCIREVLYYRCLRMGSLTVRQKTLQMLRYQFAACWQQCNDLSAWGYRSEGLDKYRFNRTFSYCMQTKMDETDKYYVEAARFLNEVANVPEAITWKRRLLLSVFRLSPRLFHFICRLWGKQVEEP